MHEFVSIMAEEQEYPLHECIFSGDLRKLSALLRSNDIAKKDKHGALQIYLFLKCNNSAIVTFARKIMFCNSLSLLKN